MATRGGFAALACPSRPLSAPTVEGLDTVSQHLPLSSSLLWTHGDERSGLQVAGRQGRLAAPGLSMATRGSCPGVSLGVAG